MRHFKTKTEVFISLIMCFCMIATILGTNGLSFISTKADETYLDDDALHFMVRHWHSVDSLNEGDSNLVEGYIRPSEKDPSSYVLYSYSSEGNNFVEMPDSYKTLHHIIFDSTKGTVTIGLEPATDDDDQEIEEFSGVTASAGHEVITANGKEIKITYPKNSDIHVAKAHVYYVKTMEATGKRLGEDNLEQDTEIKDNVKYYNTDSGLHTDKTASVSKISDDGRTFDLTLESWFVGDNVFDVGMVLDASGSMAFTTDEPQPIILDDKMVEGLGIAEKEKLDADTVNQILDQHYTDNSGMSYSDYTYYVYDYREDNQEYVPLGYWGGKLKTIGDTSEIPAFDSLLGYYSFENEMTNDYTGGKAFGIAHAKNSLENTFSNKEVKATAWATGTGHSGAKGLDVDKLVTNEDNGDGKGAGLLLDALPSSGSFTISFAIKDNTGKTLGNSSPEPIISIVPLDKSCSDNTYYQVVRREDKSGNGNHVDFREGNAQRARKKDVFKDKNWHILTFVVDGENVIAYGDGQVGDMSGSEPGNEKKKLTHEIDPQGMGIVIGGLLEGQSITSSNLILDDLYIFDRALTAEEVKELYNHVSDEKYSGLQHVAVSDTGSVIAINEDNGVDTVDADALAGWYYVNSSGTWEHYNNVQLSGAKQFRGVRQGKNTTVQFHDRNGDSVSFDVDAYGPSIFYYKDEDIDGDSDTEHVLYCAFNFSGNNESVTEGKNPKPYPYETSPVYMKPDDSRIKVEALQAALGIFTAGLDEKSPDSRVSAARFSTKNAKDDLDKLVLLDWTKDPVESSDILGLQRRTENGEANTTVREMSVPSEENETDGQDPIAQYNYGLTGGTYTWTGLQAYITYLDERIERSDENHQDAEKYLIIFTDGLDNNVQEQDEDKNKAIELTNQLKREGYTIYCVMLANGTVKEGNSNYETAEEFLQLLSGRNEVTIPSDASDKPHKETEEDVDTEYFFASATPQELQADFEVILDEIRFTLKDYTVKDYVDPRFNLVDAYGNVIYLNAGGTILAPTLETAAEKDVIYEEYDLNDSKTDGYKFMVNAEWDCEQTARLCYNSSEDMYYLLWEGVEIPGCSIGAEKLEVWTTQITVQAKEDFIGGNGMLTNGNVEDMNMVYANAEKADGANKSSGTTDMYHEKHPGKDHPEAADAYPSKGFPRTTVNVKLSDFEVDNGSQVIYLGEDIDPWEILKNLGEKIRTGADDSNLYWEYLSRYANEVYHKDLDYLLKEIDEALLKTGTYELPYMYLPNADDSNQTGTSAHESDPLGDLSFVWELVSEDEELSKNEPYTATNTKQKKYKLTVSFTPYPEKLESTTGSDEVDRRTLLTETDEDVRGDNPARGLIKDEDYHNPKSAVGTEQKASDDLTKSGEHTTDIVKGEIHLDMRLKKSDLEYLKAHSTKDDWTMTYCTDLVRTYTDASGKSVETVVGTLTATYDLADLDSEDWDENNCITIPATFKVSEEYNKLGFTEHLPIGTYTFEERTDETVAPSPFVFNEEVEILKVTEDTEESLFTLLPDILEAGETPADYAAPYDQTKGDIYLGTAEGTRPVDYLNDRLGLARISGSLELGNLEITKKVGGVVTDEPEEDPDFTFAVQLFETKPEANADGVSLVGPYDYKVYNKDGTEAKSDTIAHGETFTLKAGQSVVIEDLPKGAYYEVTEVEAKMPGGYTPKDKAYTKSGTISGSVDKAGRIIADEVTFTNDYAATATLEDSLLVKKVFDREWRAGDSFTFTLTPDEAAKTAIGNKEVEIEGYDDDAGTASVTITDEDVPDYTKAFGKMTFHSNGKKTTDYTFTVAETKGSEPGVGYATNSYTVTLRVTDNEDGTMAVELVQDDDETTAIDSENPFEMEFENTYTVTPITQILNVKKNIRGDVPEGKDYTFDFTLSTNEKSGVTMPKDKTVQVTVSSKETTATEQFGAITFTRAGTYEFEISENTEDPIQGFVYDNDSWTAEVVVTEEIDKTTKAVSLKVESVTYTRDAETETDAAVFTNQYDPGTAVYAPQVTKAITGEVPSADSVFTFTIADTGASAGVKMPAKKNVIVTGTGSAKFGNIIFSKAGTYTFTITEEDGGLTGYTYDDQPWTLTVKVADNDGKLEIETVSYTRGTETAEDAAEFTNIYQPEEITFAPSVKKEIDGLTPPSAGTFTFEISTSNNTDAGVTMPAKKNVTVTGAGSAEFDDITFSKAGTYTFTITEEAGKLAGYTYDDSEWTLTVEVTDVDGKLQVSEASYTKGTGASAQTETDAAVFTNIYTPGAAVYVPQVTKAITGGTPPTIDTDIFTFTLTESAADLDKVLAEPLTAEVTGEGTASFDALTFTKAGTYSFTITEEDDALPGYTYDTAEWTLTVTVVDQDGKLQVDEDRTSYQKTVAGGQTVSELEAAVFENDYEAEGTEYAPRVEKDITGDKPTDNKTFTFTLAADAENPEGAALPNNKTLKIKGADSGVFDEITFTKAGTYKFTITEQDDALPGYTYDTNEWTLTVVVEDVASELIVESAAYVQDGATTEYDWATFTNTYKLTPVTYRAEVQKTVEGDVPEDQTFTFTMTAKDDNPKSGASLKPGEQLTITVVGSGKGLFDAIEFTRPGTYCYEIREHRDDLSGYTYDGTVWTMKVEVTDRDSQLETKVTYTDHTGQTADLAGFLNIYRADPVGVTPNVEKKINGNLSSAQKDFTFTLEFAEGDESGVQLPEVTSVTRTGVGTTAFDEIIFTKAGTYLFDIKEELEHIPGYTFDPSTWQLKVVVTDHGGVLGADASYTNLETGEERSQEAIFTNIYQTLSVGFEPKVIKTVIGDVPKDETFTFILLADPDNPEGAELPQETEVTITGSGETLFGDITFTEPGTYVFEIDEEQGDVSGYTYDDNAWTLTIEVIDVDGQLEVAAAVYERADEEPNETAAHFENSYRPERTAYAPVIEKVISGDTPETPTEFTFELQADPENETGAVLPAVRTVTVTGEGTAEFENIIFTKAGTYTFEIRETAGDVAGYTYDDSVWTLTVEVEDRNAALDVTKVTYTKNGANESSDTLALFENIFDEFDEPDEPSTDNEIVEPPTEPDTTDDSTTSEPPTTPDVPTDSNTTSKTGDSMNPILWVLIMILALLAAGATVFYRRRNRL